MAWGGSGGNVRLSHLLISFLYLNACTGKGQYQSAQCSLQTHLLGGRVRPHVVSVQSFLFLFKVSFSSFCGGFRLPYRTMWHWLRPPLYRHSTHDQPTINQPTTSVTRGVAISSSMNSNAKITIVRNCFSRQWRIHENASGRPPSSTEVWKFSQLNFLHTHREDVVIPREADEMFVAADDLYRRIVVHYLDWLQRHANCSSQTQLAVTVLWFMHTITVRVNNTRWPKQ